MSIRVLCERCGKSYDFKSEHVGKRFRCKMCDKVLEVRDMIAEFENIESFSSEVSPPPKQPEQPANKPAAANHEIETDTEEDPLELEITKRKKSKPAKGKKEEKEKEQWQERLQIKNNTYQSPGQVIVKMLIKNLYMVIFVMLGFIGVMGLMIYLLFY